MDLYEKAWSGKHGKEYSERCDVKADSRQSIFFNLLQYMELDRDSAILEVGCNKGHNLEAIRSNYKLDVIGIEINKELCTKPSIINGSIYELPWKDNVMDLVFSSGVLIHIPPGRLHEAMDEMRRVTSKYLMMIEYPAEKETGTKYGEDFGFNEGVWARPYGDIYRGYYPGDTLEAHGKISGLGDDGWGFSKCDYWIFRKYA